MNQQRVKEVVAASGLLLELSRIVGRYAETWVFAIGGGVHYYSDHRDPGDRMVDRFDGETWLPAAALPSSFGPSGTMLDPWSPYENRLLTFDYARRCYAYDCTTDQWSEEINNHAHFQSFLSHLRDRWIVANLDGFIYTMQWTLASTGGPPAFARFDVASDAVQELPIMMENQRTLVGYHDAPWICRGEMYPDPWRSRLWMLVANGLVYFDAQSKKWFDGPNHPCLYQALSPTEQKYRLHRSQLRSGCKWLSHDDEAEVAPFLIPGSAANNDPAAIIVFETQLAVVVNHHDNSADAVHLFDPVTHTWKSPTNNTNFMHAHLIKYGEGSFMSIVMQGRDVAPSGSECHLVSVLPPLKSASMPSIPLARARRHFVLAAL